MKYLCLFILITFLSLPVLSQVTFEKTFGTLDDDEGQAVAVCQDGTYILAGYVENIYTGDADVFLARLNLYGDTIWTRTFANAYDDDYACDLLQSFDLGFLITGYTYSGNTPVPFLLKYDEQGQFLWFKKYSSQVPYGYAIAMVQKPDSNFMICGREDFYNADWYHRPFLLETDRDGNCTWSGIYMVEEYAYYDSYNLCLSAENEYVMCGYFEQPIVSTIEHAWLFKVNSGMNIAWSRAYGPSGYTSHASDLVLTDDGGFMLSGSTFQGELPLPGTNYNVYLIKTDSAGTGVWSKSIGNADWTEYGRCVDKTFDGGYIVGGVSSFGTSNSEIWLLKTDEAGDTLWTRRFGGNYDEDIADICATPDGGYLFCGLTESFSQGGSDIYLVKTDANGLLTGINDREDVLSGIEISPNPSSGIFSLQNCPDDLIYMIYDVSGKILVKDKTAKGTDEMVDISNFPPGVYFLKMVTSSSTRSQKIIIN
jgi:hypothetical protein